MKSRDIKILFAALALMICAAIPALGQISTAKVAGGTVEGVVKDGVASFKGIPFAAPPVGDLRWRSPQPVKPWQGVRKADKFAPGPMQDTEFGKIPNEAPHPNLEQLKAFDAYFAKLREQANRKK